MFDLLPESLRLSLFPDLYSLWPLAPFLLRIAVGVLLTRDGFRRMINPAVSARLRVLGFFKTILGLLLFVGLWTQAAALLLGGFAIAMSFKKHRFEPDSYQARYYLLLAVIAASLIILGPGWWAAGLPL